jgi:hypothetical protein
MRNALDHPARFAGRITLVRAEGCRRGQVGKVSIGAGSVRI